MVLVDGELVQEPMAEGLQDGVDGLGAVIGQGDRPAGALVVAPGAAQPVDHVAEDLAGVAVEVADPRRELQLPVEEADRQRPVDLVEADEEVGQLGDDVGLGDPAAPAHHHVAVQEGVRQGVLERGEMALGELGVADLGEQVLVGAGKSQTRAPSSSELASRG